MKTVLLLSALFFFFSPLGHAAPVADINAQVRDQIEMQTRAMSAAGVPSDSAREMLTMMHRNHFKAEAIAKARQAVIDCARAGLPTEPVINKAMEGMAKQAGEDRIVAAMQAVSSRYAYANRLAKRLAADKNKIDTLTTTIADTLAAGMKIADMETVMARLQVETRQKTSNQAENLGLQTTQTMRTMARLGLRSADISETVSQALQNRYTDQQMQQLRNQIARQAHQASPQQIAAQHAGSIGKGGSGGSAGGSGSPGGPGAGGSGGGAGGGGAGGGGSGGSK